MGFDLKAAADSAGTAVQSLPQSLPSARDVMAWLPSADVLRPFSGLLFLAGLVIAARAMLLHTAIGKRAARGLEEMLFSNWRLALLGATGLVLSLASGYTTWDGMRAFTGEGVLSAMVTFGIQGVMLIVAWLIGESFATGMSHRPERSEPRAGFTRGSQAALGGVVGLLLFLAIMVLVLQSTGQVDVRSASAADLGWSKFGDKALIVAVGLLLAALITLYSASDIVAPYLQSSRVILKNAVLWIMFLSCMATSVFFSFNSLFSVIFPQDQRVRAAELRAQNQVAGIVADIGSAITTKRLSESEELFNSDGWRAYDKQLSALAHAAQGSSTEIETYFNNKIEERNRAIKQQQERITTAQSSQAGLASKKVSLTDELSAIEAQRPGLAAEFAEKKAALDARAKEVDAKRVEAMAEDKGVEGSGKVGRGPMYRQRMDELGKLTDYMKIGEERVKDAQKRLSTVETRIAQIKRELAALDGDLAKYKGEAETAEQRIKLTQEQLPTDSNARVDPARMLPAFESLRAEFRQEPNADRLNKVQQMCGQIQTAMLTATPETKKKAAGVDCDPKHAAEAAQLVFSLNEGSLAFKQGCEGGDKLNQHKSADALFGFARKCLADSGLPSKETDGLRSKINTIELNRDDKAHPLVATVNAFIDGNRLAYLALFIALSMDMLIFMSGLFGANAVRSPLSDVPSLKPRSAQQLEAIIETALLPDKFHAAQIVRAAMHPIQPVSGFTNEVRLASLDPDTAARVRTVLNAAATIGAVRQVTRADGQQVEGHYLVRAELNEFLGLLMQRELKHNAAGAERGMSMHELETRMTEALLPDVRETANVFLAHLHPIEEEDGFTSEINMAEVKEGGPELVSRVRIVLNAGSTLGKIRQTVSTTNERIAGRYDVHKDLYKTLARLRARSLVGGWSVPQLAPPSASAAGVQWGGSLNSQHPALPAASAMPQQPLLQHQAQPPRSPSAGPDQQPAAQDAAAAQPVPAYAQQAQVRDSYVAALLNAIGVDYEHYLAIPHEAYGAAVAASEAFFHARKTNALLDDELATRDDEARSALMQVKARMRQGLDPENSWAFESASKEVEDNLPVLMMLPGARYDQVLLTLIASLEEANGDGTLTPQDAALYRASVGLRGALAAGVKTSQQGWSAVEQALLGLARGTHLNLYGAGRQLNS